MKIVIDTNVLISGVFFGGFPKKVLLAVVENEIKACASSDILSEYVETVREMVRRRQGKINVGILEPLISRMEIIEPISDVKICRDEEDDKFINCAKDADAVYIVSGDKDLLVVEKFGDIEIITAKEFCERHL